MKKQHLWILLILLGLVILTPSCRKKQHVQVSAESLTFSYAGGNDVFQIEADCDWTIEKESGFDWLSFTPTQGTNNATISVIVEPNNSSVDRSTSLKVVSANGKVKRVVLVNQNKVDISILSNKYWFLHYYERWATDYYNQLVPETYNDWNYYLNPGYENWFFYFFNDSTGYQLHTKDYDTIIYPYDYIFYPDGDSLYINFETLSDTVVEDYHVTIRQLTGQNLVLFDEYRWHQFEKLALANVSRDRGTIHINPKKIKQKPHGPLIPVD